jgi:acetyl esterase/lipase
MYAALQKAGVNSEYHEYPTGGHAWGFGRKPDLSPPGWLDITLYGWLKKMALDQRMGTWGGVTRHHVPCV